MAESNKMREMPVNKLMVQMGKIGRASCRERV